MGYCLPEPDAGVGIDIVFTDSQAGDIAELEPQEDVSRTDRTARDLAPTDTQPESDGPPSTPDGLLDDTPPAPDVELADMPVGADTTQAIDVTHDDIVTDIKVDMREPDLPPECSVLSNEPCSEGMKCAVSEVRDRLECVSIVGNLQLGETCGEDGDDDCGVGLRCASTCEAFCEPDSDPSGCAEGYSCRRLYDLNAGVCELIPRECDPIAQDCFDGLKCFVVGQSFMCIAEGDKAEGEICSLPDDCMAGLVCVSVGFEDAVCMPICDPDGGSCPGEQICLDLDGFLDYGFCYDMVQCSVTEQDCDANEKCSISAAGVRCVAEGIDLEGQPCTLGEETDTCATGLVCAGDGTNFTCEELCEPESDPTGCDSGVCSPITGWEIVNVGFCYSMDDDCDPIAQTGCNPGLTCVPQSTEVTTCTRSGDVEVGEPCQYAEDCMAGLLCAIAGDSGYTCSYPCNPSGGPVVCPEQGQLCIPLNVGQNDWGFCVESVVECSVRDQDCGPGMKCAAIAEGLVCVQNGESAVGELCEPLLGNDTCSRGAVCLEFSGVALCRELCEPYSIPTGCVGDMTCEEMGGYFDGINAGVCVGNECSINDQNCGQGMKCTIAAFGETICAVAGNVALNEPCDGGNNIDNCAAGLICVGNETEVYTCQAFCEPDDPIICGEDAVCIGFTGGFSGGYCESLLNECSVLEQDCGAGSKCTVYDTGIECHADGTFDEGERCGMAGTDDCAAGLICISLGGGELECMRICEPESAPNGCNEFENCLYIGGLEHFNVGACVGGIECSIFEQDCGPGQKCTLGLVGIECATAGNAQEGQNCGQLGFDNCAAGLLCAGSGTTYECMSLCEPQSNPTGCDVLESCLLLLGMETLNVGVCDIVDTNCNPVTQTGCDAGFTCYPWSYPSTAICVEAGSTQLWEPCEYDCTEGIICWYETTEAQMGTCRNLCNPNGSVDCPEGFCEAVATGLGICGLQEHECSVLEQNCPDGERCSLGSFSSLRCVDDGALQPGEACTGAEPCVAGTECFGSEDDGYSCMRLCEPFSGGAGCPDWQVCNMVEGWSIRPPDGADPVNVGVCIGPEINCEILQGGCPDNPPEYMRCCSPDYKCFPTADGTFCVEAGPVEEGGICTYDIDASRDNCSHGLICSDIIGYCLRLCEPDSTPNGCDAGSRCQTLFGFPPEINVGICDNK